MKSKTLSTSTASEGSKCPEAILIFNAYGRKPNPPDKINETIFTVQFRGKVLQRENNSMNKITATNKDLFLQTCCEKVNSIKGVILKEIA